MTRRPALIFILTMLLAAASVFAAGCGTTTITERVTQLVVLTPEVPEVTRLATVEITHEITVEVTVLVTQVRRETIVVTATPVPPPDRLGEAAAFQAAVRWLVEQQQASGGFGSAKQTAWAVLALHAAGIDPATLLTENERSPFTQLDSMITDNLIVGAETSALVALALEASGREAPEALGLTVPPYPNASAGPALPLTIIALGRRTPGEVAAALGAAKANGFKDAEQAAWQIMALKALGRAPDADALDYLKDAQEAGALWPGASGARASALVMQALAAAGEDPLDWGAPAHALLALQRADGSFDGDLITTAMAIIALQETWPGALTE
ncbi:MAG: hypothetical protein JXB47_12295 [Anaerolineae bacterium]|nr:hypothetical protein [Anaerolineae bacterium]